MASVASQLIEEVTAHAQSDSLEDARVICADGTYFPNNLRKIYLQEVGCGDMDWIDLAQDRDRWQALANVVIYLRVP